MSNFCTPIKDVVARKPHQCTSCGEAIVIGEKYAKWTSFEDSAFSNKMHAECYKAHDEDRVFWGGGQWEYTPYSYPRGDTA